MNKWKLLQSTPIVNSSWLDFTRNRYQTDGGEVIEDYYILSRRDFVLVVATDRDALIMVRQYRPATDRDYLALPAGYVDDGESPIDAACRELREETGCVALAPRLIGELHPLPGYIRSRAFVVICETSANGTSHPDQQEIDEVKLIPWSEVLALIDSGEINEMQAVSAILLANRPAHQRAQPAVR